MEYLPDVYQHFERAFPHVHSAHQELAKACYEGGPLDERAARLVKLGIAPAHRRREPSVPIRAARSARARAGKKCATSACLP